MLLSELEKRQKSVSSYWEQLELTCGCAPSLSGQLENEQLVAHTRSRRISIVSITLTNAPLVHSAAFTPTPGQQNRRCAHMGATVPLIWTLYKARLQRFGVMLPVHGNA